jgi:hypothetical protein
MQRRNPKGMMSHNYCVLKDLLFPNI